MGYYTSVDGEITITPPLSWAEIKDSPFVPSHPSSDELDVNLVIDETSTDTDEGTLLRRSSSTLRPSSDEAFKAYHLIEHVQQAIDAFPGHEFTGRLTCEGEEAGDLWRVVIRDGRAVKVTPRIVWPDDGQNRSGCCDCPHEMEQ